MTLPVRPRNLRTAHLLAACLWCSACGSPSDAALPVNVDELGTDGTASRSAAVLDLHTDRVGTTACSLEAQVTLPDRSAEETLLRGVGSRLHDAENASIRCRVQASSSAPDAFEIDLRLQQAAFQLQLGGLVRKGPDNAVTLSAAMAGVGTLVASCAADARTLVPGAVWIASLSCVAPALEARPLPSCALLGATIFEDCAR
jgi:hypothetical protein